MDSTRQLKVSRLLQKELGDVFIKEMKPVFGNAMVTVTQVRISPDLGVAKVYLSLFNVPNPKLFLQTIDENKKDIRMKLGMRVKMQVRVIPELIFYLDDSLDYAMRINELLQK